MSTLSFLIIGIVAAVAAIGIYKVLDNTLWNVPEPVVIFLILLGLAGGAVAVFSAIYMVVDPIMRVQHAQAVEQCIAAFETYTRAQCEFIVTRGFKP